MNYIVTRIIYLAILITITFIGFYRWRKNPRAYKLGAVLALAVLVLDGSGVFMSLIGLKPPTVILYRLFAPIEIALLTAIFLSILKEKKFRGPIIFTAVSIAAYITVYDMMRKQDNTIDTLPILVKCFYYIILSLLVFREYMIYPNENDILKEQNFWLISAVLFVNTMVIMYWSCRMLMTSTSTKSLGDLIMVISNHIYYSLLGYSLFIGPKKVQIKADEIG